MVFRRRDPRTWRAALTEVVFPRGGWSRATQYVFHRVRRLPDPPHRIGRGVAAGVFISFTPLFGLHLVGAAVLAWAIRGNIVAALLATFFGNPLTYPIFAYFSVWLGHWMLGIHSDLGITAIIDTFSGATDEFWGNIKAIFTSEPTRWTEMSGFFRTLFLPDLIGSIPLGVLAGVISHYLTLPVVEAYKRRRGKKLRERVESLRAAKRAKELRHDRRSDE